MQCGYTKYAQAGGVSPPGRSVHSGETYILSQITSQMIFSSAVEYLLSHKEKKSLHQKPASVAHFP